MEVLFVVAGEYCPAQTPEIFRPSSHNGCHNENETSGTVIVVDLYAVAYAIPYM